MFTYRYIFLDVEINIEILDVIKKHVEINIEILDVIKKHGAGGAIIYVITVFVSRCSDRALSFFLSDLFLLLCMVRIPFPFCN